MKYLTPFFFANAARSFPMVCSLTADFQSEAVFPRYPVGAGQRNAGHGGSLERQRAQILRLEVVDVVLAAGPRDRLRLQRHDLEVVGKAAAGGDRIDTARQFGVLRR